LSHSASFESCDKNAPSKPGTKHLEHFKLLAAYNRWANARLYAAALDLSDLSYRLQTGVYFGSLHRTLNHLLLTDMLWLKRLTGEGDHPNELDAILHEDRIELPKARIAETTGSSRSPASMTKLC
jgi:uncharacterized damage-inducible protein DinB